MTASVLRIIARMNVGGPAQQLTGLLERLDPQRFDQTLVVGEVDDGEEDWFRLRRPDLARDGRIVRLPRLGRPVSPVDDLLAYRQLRHLIRDRRPDIVHTHTAKAGVLGRLAAYHEGVPVVVHTFHGHVLHGYFPAKLGRAIAALERRLARRSDALLAVGGRVRDELLAAGIGEADRYVVVPPGVVAPASWEAAAARDSFGIEPGRPVVGYVGRLAGVKRPDRLIEVANRVARHHSDVVVLVGGGADPEVQRELQRQVDLVDVRFLGWIADVGRLYAASDVVVLTSDNEGMPVSLIEAGMCSRPVVATDVGGVSEVVIDGVTGRVVGSEVEALAGALAALLDDPVLATRYGVAAREHTARFAMQTLIETTQELYSRLLEPPSTT